MIMTSNNGHGKYELTQNPGLWTDDALVNYVLDTESIMGLEKFEVARLAQEVASRFEPYITEGDEVDEHEFNE
jgi:hypothetical protein